MTVLSYIFAFFALLGAIDKILNNKFGLGKEFEKGFNLLGPMALTMIGMLSLAPVIAEAMHPAFNFIYNVFKIDPSVIPASILANDMGAAPLARELAKTAAMGGFNGLIVSAMMGVNISYTIPVSLGIVKKEDQKDLFAGFLCGFVTVPLGCFVSGLMLKINIGILLYNLLPLIIFAVLLTLGLIFFKNVCIKLFDILGKIITIIITLGLALSLWQFLTGNIILKSLDSFESGGIICLNAAAVLAGAFPLMHVISLILKKPLSIVSQKTGLKEASVLGFLFSSVSCLPTLGAMEKMDKRGIILNSAFIVSASFTFGSHLAFTMAFDKSYVLSMIVGKLISGICAVIVAILITKKTVDPSDTYSRREPNP